ncbi:MAG: GNAT family N-acetyltransferase [Anaerolineae bacterium]
MAQVLPLFRQLPYDLVPHAIAAGVATGHVYVDDAGAPKAALVWDGGWDVFLTGDPLAPAARSALARPFAENILPRAAAEGRAGFVIFPSAAWEAAAIEAVLPGRRLVPARRALYTEVTVAGEPPAPLPSGFRVEPVDGAFMAHTDLKSAESLLEWLHDCWLSPATFAEHGFGICILEGDEVVSWCMAEYVSGGRCGIGIETTEGYRRRGFAAIAADAFVRACRERGLRPHWECWANNAGSVATAEKVGFTGRMDYGVFRVPLG